MGGLECTSHRGTRSADPGRTRHGPREDLPRHPHDHAFAAVVLSGGYVEAGDTGRHAVEAGDVLLHRAWESHLDRFDARGAEVLVLPIADRDTAPLIGRVADPDAIARLAERDRTEAARRLLAELAPRPAPPADWPDMLARALRDDPDLSLALWADRLGLHPGSISRGFRQVFGVTPVAFRLVQRTRQALGALQISAAPLSAIAYDCGFADQAHMSRAVRGLTNATPTALRRAAGMAS
ncbi:AraC family transcriptional regulator [Sphingomonas sp. MMSM20]|uniref:helix-turn-helix domain-containing protein n=1 Tax=Sphingomonas lycopersici TaxID=2951807 RepID=UPI00223714E1|nr:AraC family transcriptional regulator [Sphingomonas lycopersici]MCW6531271.1 AraC family transcriptional regulator [Sphingomonas lycopersici]